MERPTTTITDHLTGETITRELNDEEWAEFLERKQVWDLIIANVESATIEA